jgi:IMP dehydrogenase
MPKHADKTVAERMLSVDRMKYAKLADVIEDGAPNLNKAWDILGESHQNSLPIVNDSEELVYVVFKKDAESRVEHPRELMDKKRRLMCGAAVNTHDYKTRSKLLADAEVDLFVVDASQGMSDYMVETVRYLKENYDQPVIAGNIVTKEGFRMLAKAGADTVKVGMGSGYICSTQDQKRVGRGQATAVMEVVAAANELYKKDGVRIPIISDGGVLNFGDMTVALALGPSAVMVGRLVAGCRESPTDIITINDNEQVKPVWGEASLKAQAWQKERYEQNIFEEGFETVVPYVGQLKPYMQKGLARVRAGVRDAGCRNIRELHTNRNVTLEPMSSIMREEIEVKRGRAINVKLALLAAETGSKTK